LGIIFSVFVILVVSYGIYKIISGKGAPDNSYTPFDYITSQTDTEFKKEKKTKQDNK